MNADKDTRIQIGSANQDANMSGDDDSTSDPLDPDAGGVPEKFACESCPLLLSIRLSKELQQELHKPTVAQLARN